MCLVVNHLSIQRVHVYGVHLEIAPIEGKSVISLYSCCEKGIDCYVFARVVPFSSSSHRSCISF